MDLDGASPILMTLDVDWAPDWMIEAAAQALKAAGVRATWFATHQSPATTALLAEPLFEVGLHPNFLAGSSHGATPDAVMTTLRSWFPAARSVRTHSLAQSEPTLALMADRYGVEVDCSIHLQHAAHVAPHSLVLSDGGARLVRIPHVFQDNMHMMSGYGWDFPAPWLQTPGLKVMNFHPVHLALNSDDSRAYDHAKTLGPLSQLTPSHLPVQPAGAPGARRFFQDILAHQQGQRTLTVIEAATLWRAGEGTA